MAEPTILIAHSDEQASEAMRAALAQRDYDVIAVVQSSSDAVQYLNEQAPDLALVDVHLDGRYTGFQVGTHIFSASNAPVVYVATDTDAAVAERMGGDEAFGLITRPHDPGALTAQVKVALHRHQQERGAWTRLAGLVRLLDAMPEAVVTVNSEGQVTYANAQAKTFAQAAPSEAEETSASRLFPVAESGPHPVEQLLRGEDADSHVTLMVEGEERSVQSRALVPVAREDGSAAGAVWVFQEAPDQATDASEGQRAKERLRVLEELIAEMGLGDRLEAMIQERRQTPTDA